MAPPPPVAYFYIYPQAMTLGMSELCIVLVRPLPPTRKQASGGWGSVYLLPADVAPTPPARQQVSGPGVTSGTSPGAEDGVGQQLQPPPRPPLPASLLEPLGSAPLGAVTCGLTAPWTSTTSSHPSPATHKPISGKGSFSKRGPPSHVLRYAVPLTCCRSIRGPAGTCRRGVRSPASDAAVAVAAAGQLRVVEWGRGQPQVCIVKRSETTCGQVSPSTWWPRG